MATEKDVVLIYLEEKPLVFARIEDISPDAKPDWYHVKLLMLQVPLQTVTWILRDVYINGETFTMEGKRVRLELVTSSKIEKHPEDEAPALRKKMKKDPGNKVISFRDFKKE